MEAMFTSNSAAGNSISEENDDNQKGFDKDGVEEIDARFKSLMREESDIETKLLRRCHCAAAEMRWRALWSILKVLQTIVKTLQTTRFCLHAWSLCLSYSRYRLQLQMFLICINLCFLSFFTAKRIHQLQTQPYVRTFFQINTRYDSNHALRHFDFHL